MKILQIISSGGFYGAEAMVLHLSRALRGKGHAIHIGVMVNRKNPHDEIATRAREFGFEVVTIPCRGRLDIRAVRRIRACVEQYGVDIIHSHGYKSNSYALAANCFAKRALVSTCHNWTRQTKSLRIYEMLDRFSLRFFDRILCVSEEIRGTLLAAGVPVRKLDVILNGIPVSDFALARASAENRVELQEPVIGMVGRLVEAKGFQLVLESAPAILRRFPKARFVLAGEGPQSENWIRLIRELGIESNVTFAGNQTDMPRTYSSFSMFVLPSYNEGMPMTILEAMAAGLPVIATRVGSIPQLVYNEKTGLLVNKGDRAGLQSAIERLLENPGFGRELGNRGQQFVTENASVERMADRYIAHYKDLLPMARLLNAGRSA